MSAIVVIVVLVVAALAVMYFLNRQSQRDMPWRRGQHDQRQVVRQLIRGCLHRLQGVKRESQVSESDIRSFASAGDRRLVVITNVDPDRFIERLNAGSNLQAVAISSAIVKGAKSYIVMAFANGSMHPIGAPTPNFAEAFRYLESAARRNIGNDSESLVFYINEDIPCPLFAEEESGSVEQCCGRRA